MQHTPSTQALRVPYLLVLPSASPGCLPKQQDGVRYVRDGVKNMLCCMGVKNRHAFKIAHQVFVCAAAHLPELAKPQHRRSSALANWSVLPHGSPSSGEVCICLPRAEFYELLCSCLAEHNYKCTPSSEELRVACSLRERRKCVVVLICGTSGSGKSTLASILANRLGITTVISTDSVRHMLRSFATKEEAPLLYASTYQAGDSLPKANHKLDHSMEGAHAERSDKQQSSHAAHQQGQGVGGSDLERAILGYKAQCEPVVHKLDVLISDFEARKQSLVIEGVHLSISLVIKLMQRHPSVTPFLVYIKSEAKHMERMAVRAKYMTLDPQKNRYVAHMHCIRWIQDYQVRKADLHLIPKVENSNVDQSVGLIHVALTGTLKRTLNRGEPVLDPKSNTARVLHAELRAAAESLNTTSKAMVEQVRLAESAHAAYASAPLPSWPSDSETAQGSDTAHKAAHVGMPSSASHADDATTAAKQPQPHAAHPCPPVLDFSLGKSHLNGTAEPALHLAGSSSLAPVSAPQPTDIGPGTPFIMLSPVGLPAATGLLRRVASVGKVESSAVGQPHQQPLHHHNHHHHHQQQQQQQELEQGQSMPGSQTLADRGARAGSAGAVEGTSPPPGEAGALNRLASPLLPVPASAMGKSASSTCLYSRDGKQGLRPLSACCARTGLCHIPRMAAALTTPPKDTMQAAKQVKAARAQGSAAGNAGMSHAQPACSAIRPSTSTTRDVGGPTASSSVWSQEDMLQHSFQASSCNHHLAPMLKQQSEDTSHANVPTQPSSLENPIRYPQQNQQQNHRHHHHHHHQQEEPGCMDGEHHHTSSSACHLSSSRSAAIEDGEARDTFTEDSLLALPRRASSRTGMSHKHASTHSYQRLQQSPYLLPLSPNQAHKQQLNQQHHHHHHQQQQHQQQPWRSSRWIGRRGGKHAPKAVHPALPLQSSPFSSPHPAHGAAAPSSSTNPQSTASIDSPEACAATAQTNKPCLLNSDDDNDDEALAAMCCAEASSGRARGVPKLLDVGSQGLLDAGVASTSVPGHTFGVHPPWDQRSFTTLGNSSAAESDTAEPSFMLMGYGSLAETYDEFTEDGEDLQSQHSSTKHSSGLIARLQRLGSSHGSRMGEHATLCNGSSVGASPQQQQQPPSASLPPLHPQPALSSESSPPTQASTKLLASQPEPVAGQAAGGAAVAGSSQPGGMGDAAASGNAVAAGKSGREVTEGFKAAGCGHQGEQGVQHSRGGCAVTGRSAEEETDIRVHQQQWQQGVPQLVMRSSNSTIVRHLAGAMARSKMRATANSIHPPSYPSAANALLPPSSTGDTSDLAEAGGLSVHEDTVHLNHSSHVHQHGSAPSTPSRSQSPVAVQTPARATHSGAPAIQDTAFLAGSARLASRRGSSFNAPSTAAHSQHSPRSKSSLSRHSFGHTSQHHQHPKAYHAASRSAATAGEGSSRESLGAALDVQQDQTHSLAAAEELLRSAGAHIKSSSRPSRC